MMVPEVSLRQRMVALHSEGLSKDDSRDVMKQEGYKKARLSQVFCDWPCTPPLLDECAADVANDELATQDYKTPAMKQHRPLTILEMLSHVTVEDAVPSESSFRDSPCKRRRLRGKTQIPTAKPEDPLEQSYCETCKSKQWNFIIQFGGVKHMGSTTVAELRMEVLFIMLY